MSGPLIAWRTTSRHEGWAVLHVPTGLCLIKGWQSKRGAVACIERLSALDGVDWATLSRKGTAALPRSVHAAVRDERRKAVRR